jgi:hypothetical protein
MDDISIGGFIEWTTLVNICREIDQVLPHGMDWDIPYSI